MSVKTAFWEVSLSHAEAKEVHKDGVCLSSSVASRYMANLKPVLQAEALRQVNRPFSEDRFLICCL